MGVRFIGHCLIKSGLITREAGVGVEPGV
jgi:hypothetical protein